MDGWMDGWMAGWLDGCGNTSLAQRNTEISRSLQLSPPKTIQFKTVVLNRGHILESPGETF